MNYTVPSASIISMAVVALAGISIPIILFLVFKRRYRADKAPFFVGCSVFIIFALLIEGTINQLILTSAAGRVIRNNIWLSGIFGGLMAGLFEETGRYTAFKTVLKRNRGNDANALMYGAGHGGFEAAYILVFSMATYISMAFKLNAGMGDTMTTGITDTIALQRLEATFAALATTPPAVYLMSVVERGGAVALQLSFSVLVWFAAKDRRHFWCYPLALLLHASADAMAVILANYVPNTWAIEGAVYALAALSAVIARAVWKRCASDQAAIVPILFEP